MRRFTVALLFSLFSIFMAERSATAVPILLSNSESTYAQIQPLFDQTMPIRLGTSYTRNAYFDFEPARLFGGDGLVYSMVFPGITGTQAEGLYLYAYYIEVNGISSDRVTGISFSFPGLITTLDVNGDGGADSSIYCTDCVSLLSLPDPSSAYPFPNFPDPSIAPAYATWDNVLWNTEIEPGSNPKIFSVIDFTFNIIPFGSGQPLYPGDISYVFGAISDREPFITMANLRDDGGEASPQVYAPVLEPSTLLLLGSGLAGLVVFRKRLKGKGL